MKIYYKSREDYIFPKIVEEKPGYIKVNKKFFKTYYIQNFPKEVGNFYLLEYLLLGGNIIINQFIKPVKKEEILNAIKFRLAAIESKKHSRISKGRLSDASLDIEASNLEDFRRMLISGKEGSASFSFYITIYSSNLSKLKLYSKNLELLSSSKSFTVFPLDFRHNEGYKTIMPQNLDLSSKNNILNISSIASSTPFVLSNLIDYEGILYGINSKTNSLLIFDVFKSENYNGVVFAKSGAGKSFFAKTNIIRLISKGVKIIVIDPEGEYTNLCKNMNGKYIDLSHKGKFHINPFDLYQGESIEEKIQFIKNFLKRSCMFFDQNEIDKALIDVFKNKKEPTFEDLYRYLNKKKSKMAQEIFNISMGSNASLYSKKTNIDLSGKDNLIVFNISSLDPHNMSLMMYVVLNFVWKIHNGKDRREVFIDEAHRLFENKDLLENLKMMTKRARKYNLGFIYITQDIEDFISSEEGRAIIANTSLKVLLKQEKVNISNLKNTFMLSDEERDSLLKFNIGESLIFFGQNRIYSKIFAFDFEKAIFK